MTTVVVKRLSFSLCPLPVLKRCLGTRRATASACTTPNLGAGWRANRKRGYGLGPGAPPLTTATPQVTTATRPATTHTLTVTVGKLRTTVKPAPSAAPPHLLTTLDVITLCALWEWFFPLSHSSSLVKWATTLMTSPLVLARAYRRTESYEATLGKLFPFKEGWGVWIITTLITELTVPPRLR